LISVWDEMIFLKLETVADVSDNFYSY